MTKDKRSGSPSSDAPGPDLKSERDQFLKKFSRGTQLTEDFLKEHERMQSRLQDLETENAGLRAKVEADQAVRELLQKIERLETEKSELVSRYREAEAITTEFTARVQEVESEFANLANLFVASNQLHSSLSPRGVTRRIKEVLAQLVGAERYAMYLVNPEGEELIPIASEGVPGADLMPVRIAGTRIGDVLKKGSASVADSDPSQGTLQDPPAVIPLSVDDRVVVTIAIFSTLAQKNKFDTVDFELFKLLGQHAAQALVAASLFAQAEHKLPGLEAFLDLSV
jgi:multidrug efflux pump subunit AcrA (membrane-fusion protein)